MKLLALLILVTMPPDGDYDTVAAQLRAWASQAGCERPVVERLTDQGGGQEEMLVRCRDE